MRSDRVRGSECAVRSAERGAGTLLLRTPHSTLRIPRRRGSATGLTLLEVMTAITISGLVALGVLTSVRIGMRAWEKEQEAVLRLRRVTGVEDLVQLQLANVVLRTTSVVLADRRLDLPFFFAEEDRLLLLSSYSALQRGRGGIVVADYFAEQQGDRTWRLWLDEQPALDSEQLGKRVAAVETEPEGPRPVLMPFERGRAVLLLEGLRECRFQYRRERPEPAWLSRWSLLSSYEMPAAIALQLRADEAQWKGLTPLPVVVRLAVGGTLRTIIP